MTNFYAIDTETSGFEHHEPLQVAAILFEDGKPTKQYNQYFLPTLKITEEATKVNGLTKEKLQKFGASHWTKGKCEMLAAFLNEFPDLPIVA